MFGNFITQNIILNNKNAFQIVNGYDIIIPVPISKKRLKERGYNQSELIAKQIAKNVQIKIETKCLYKKKNITAQSSLNKEQREENIKNVYIIKNQDRIFNKNVLLFDDIYTTGSTANECCKILKEANPNKIGVMTIAKD
jgi:ComF family protein